MEYRELAEASGIEHWRRVPALNTDPRFIRDMADMVVSAECRAGLVGWNMHVIGGCRPDLRLAVYISLTLTCT